MRGLKDVTEDAPNVDPGAFICVETQRAMTKVERPNVVEPKDVIGMTVRDQHCVEMLQSVTQSLLAKVSRGIDDHRFPCMFYQYRDAQALIPRVGGGTGLAVAGDRRNASRCAGAEEG